MSLELGAHIVIQRTLLQTFSKEETSYCHGSHIPFKLRTIIYLHCNRCITTLQKCPYKQYFIAGSSWNHNLQAEKANRNFIFKCETDITTKFSSL